MTYKQYKWKAGLRVMNKVIASRGAQRHATTHVNKFSESSDIILVLFMNLCLLVTVRKLLLIEFRKYSVETNVQFDREMWSMTSPRRQRRYERRWRQPDLTWGSSLSAKPKPRVSADHWLAGTVSPVNRRTAAWTSGLADRLWRRQCVECCHPTGSGSARVYFLLDVHKELSF